MPRNLKVFLANYCGKSERLVAAQQGRGGQAMGMTDCDFRNFGHETGNAAQIGARPGSPRASL